MNWRSAAYQTASLYIGDMTNNRLVKWPIGAKQCPSTKTESILVAIPKLPQNWSLLAFDVLPLARLELMASCAKKENTKVRSFCRKVTTSSSFAWTALRWDAMAPATWWILRSWGPGGTWKQTEKPPWPPWPLFNRMWLDVIRSIWSVKDDHRVRRFFFLSEDTTSTQSSNHPIIQSSNQPLKQWHQDPGSKGEWAWHHMTCLCCPIHSCCEVQMPAPVWQLISIDSLTYFRLQEKNRFQSFEGESSGIVDLKCSPAGGHNFHREKNGHRTHPAHPFAYAPPGELYVADKGRTRIQHLGVI